MTHTFQLNNGQEYIPLNLLLKYLQLAETGGEANIRIVEGEVKLNGVVELQKRKKVRSGDVVTMDGETIKVV